MTARAWKAIAILVVGAGLCGFASNAWSSQACVTRTHDAVGNQLEAMRATFVAHGSHQRAVTRPTTWVLASGLQDEAPSVYGSRSLLYPPHFMPSGDQVECPWAYSVRLPSFVPFVVRVAYGYNLEGQSGGVGIDYYLAFFGTSARVYQRVLGMF